MGSQIVSALTTMSTQIKNKCVYLKTVYDRGGARQLQPDLH